MKKINRFYLLSITLLLLQGCSNEYKKEMLREDLKTDLRATQNEILKKPAIEIVTVSAENFKILKSVIPDKECIKRVKILGAELQDAIALLTEATGQDIIFKLQSDSMTQSNIMNQSSSVTPVQNISTTNSSTFATDSADQVRQSKVYVSASKIGFGRLLKKAVGDRLTISYSDDTYYLGEVKTVTVKIPSLSGLTDVLKKSLETLGAINVIHDSITSSVTFAAREKEYQNIMNYLELLRNNLYVIEYNIAIYNVDLKDNYSLGINWDILSSLKNGLGFLSSTSSGMNGGAGAPSASFGAILSRSDYTASMMVDLLSYFGKVESIQRPKLLGLAGTNVTLTDGLEEPYIKEFKTTAVGNNAVQTSTVSGTALSGLRITLNSNIMDETVLTDISLEINDIVGYTEFEVDGVKYSQPRTVTKNIQNSMRVQPGIPIVISGLFRHKSDKGYKGVPGLAQTSARLLGGSEYEGVSKSEMVIIVTPRVIKYVMD